MSEINKRTLFKWVLENLEKNPSMDSKTILESLYDDFNLDEVSVGEIEYVDGKITVVKN